MRDSEKFIVDLNKKRETAWYQLYEEFYPALCAYAERITNGNVGIEDVVQECMVTLWNSALYFPNIKTLVTWLYKTIYNRSLNLIRERDTSRRFLGNYVSEVSYSEEMAIDMAIEENVISKLRVILKELPEQQRRIMEMSLQGLKVKEIAEVLQVSENTVKMQKKRAYALIRERIGGVWGVLAVLFFSKEI